MMTTLLAQETADVFYTKAGEQRSWNDAHRHDTFSEWWVKLRVHLFVLEHNAWYCAETSGGEKNRAVVSQEWDLGGSAETSGVGGSLPNACLSSFSKY